MTPTQVLDHFDAVNVSDLARKLDRPVSTVHNWFQTGKIPSGVQYEIQVRTQGALRADQ